MFLALGLIIYWFIRIIFFKFRLNVLSIMGRHNYFLSNIGFIIEVGTLAAPPRWSAREKLVLENLSDDRSDKE